MKKLIALLLCAVLALGLVACGNAPAQEKESENLESTAQPAEGEAENKTETDAVSTPSTYTNLYTNLDQAALLEEIAKYSGVTVVATTNADGTPNIAILTPGAAGDDSHIVFNLAPNTTKENILRSKQAEMVFDKVNAAAETKAERHQGAVVRLELEEDPAVLEELKKSNEYITDNSLVCKLAEVMPVG